jgi:uncharacterized protein YecE (DUF72 family)
VAATIRVGTCSWADDALTKYWYPKGVPPGARLGFYAEHFDMVEVDSTYYRLPVEEMVQRWAERTPDGFVMHVKAFGVMTRHPVKLEQLPPDLRDEAPQDERGRVDRPSREFRGEVFRRFLEALEPLRSAGKLGGLLFQFPPYVVPKEASYDYLAWAREQIGDDEMLVEFRHRSWYEEDQRDETLRFLEEHKMSHVVVDAPRTEGKNVPLTVLALTTPERGHLERARRERGRAVRLPLLRGGARRVGAAAEGAVGAVPGGLRPVQQQQPQPGRRPRGRAGADERRDAAGPAREREGAGQRARLSSSSMISSKRSGASTLTTWPAPSTTSKLPSGADSAI